MTHRTKGCAPGLAGLRSAVGGLALAGTVSLDAVARHIDTSPRTLQRRLKRLGISFRVLVEQSRFQIAGALLRETNLKVHEIAARLGYGTPGAFTRAFTRWAGQPPSAYRRASADPERNP